MINAFSGHVFLVGAGPGDPGLMTQRSIVLLQQADVVLYDYLVPTHCLQLCKSTAILDCVGKKKGEHSSTQSEINQKMLSYSKDNKMVVRLKGGDPLIFGRGGEEMEFLRANGISYQVVPGVSSASAVPAYSGIPLTHRDFSRSVAFVTGTLHDGFNNGELPQADTLVFLMAVTALETLTAILSAHPPFTKKTPAALIYRGTTADQKMVIGTVETIYAIQKENKIQTPSILVVGDVVGVAKRIEWRSLLPLSGKRIVLLRTLEQSKELAQMMELLGAEVLVSPMISLTENVEVMATVTPEFISPITDIIFTSINGVRYFFNALKKNDVDHRRLSGKTILSIGPRTKEELVQNGIFPDGIPTDFHSEAVLDLFQKELSERHILIPTTDIAEDALAVELRKRGAKVTVLPVYCTKKPEKIWGELRDGDHVLFTSASTVENACEVAFWTNQLIYAYSIGPKTSDAIQRLRPNIPIYTAINATTDAMLKLLLETIQKEKAK